LSSTTKFIFFLSSHFFWHRRSSTQRRLTLLLVQFSRQRRLWFWTTNISIPIFCFLFLDQSSISSFSLQNKSLITLAVPSLQWRSCHSVRVRARRGFCVLVCTNFDTSILFNFRFNNHQSPFHSFFSFCFRRARLFLYNFYMSSVFGTQGRFFSAAVGPFSKPPFFRFLLLLEGTMPAFVGAPYTHAPFPSPSLYVGSFPSIFGVCAIRQVGLTAPRPNTLFRSTSTSSSTTTAAILLHWQSNEDSFFYH